MKHKEPKNVPGQHGLRLAYFWPTLWARLAHIHQTGELLGDDALADAIRNEGVPDEFREYVADRIEGKHKRGRGRPPGDKFAQFRREYRALRLTRDVLRTAKRLRAVDGKRDAMARARAEIAKREKMDPETLRRLLRKWRKPLMSAGILFANGEILFDHLSKTDKQIADYHDPADS